MIKAHGLVPTKRPLEIQNQKSVTACARNLNGFHFLLVLFLFNLFSLDYGSAEEACDGSDKQEPIVIGKSPKPRCFKNVKKLPIKYHANSKAWMKTEIFCSFLHSLDAQMGAQNRQ